MALSSPSGERAESKISEKLIDWVLTVSGKLSRLRLCDERVGDGVLEVDGESESKPDVKSGEYWANMMARAVALECVGISSEDEGGEVGR